MGERKRMRNQLRIRTLAPNIVTVLALSAGLTSIRFSVSGNWEMAVFAILVAGVFDGIDGSIARMLKAASKFGAELDSLSDMISFGVAPAILLYLWSLQELGGLGWVIALIFAIGCALRLARFNSKLEADDEPRRKAGFLTGLAAPAGAGIALIPLMLEFELQNGFFRSPDLVAATTTLVALGMVSRIATFSFKQLLIRRDQMVPTLLLVALFAALLTTYGWMLLIGCGILYMATIPISMHGFAKREKERRLR